MYNEVAPFLPKQPGGPLMVIMIGRISTDHQDLESIDASYAEDERYLRARYRGELNIKRLGERGSGWKIERAAINEAMEEIATQKWDVVIMQDLGRAYRNPEFQYKIAHLCVDNRTRLICVGDGIDTGLSNWEMLLSAAVMRHGMTVPEVRRRVRTKATFAFHKGGMVLKVRYGYRRLTRDEAASGQFGPKDLRIAKVASATPIIAEVRNRILRRENYSEIVNWMKEAGIEVGKYAKSGRWTVRLLVDLLRDPILQGIRTFRDVKHTLTYATGDHRREANDNPEVEYIPELAHMTKAEQEEMWVAMDAHAPPRDKSHPRKGTARRDSYWPGQHLRCDICGKELYWASPTQLRCQNARPCSTRSCWNQVVVDAEEVRSRMLPLVLSAIREIPPILDLLIDAAWKEHKRLGSRGKKNVDECESKVAELVKRLERITTLLIDRESSESLLRQLDQTEDDLKMARKELEHQRENELSSELCLSREEIAAKLDEVVINLARTSYAFSKLMSRTFRDFRLVPVQALDTPQVHPRVKLSLPSELFFSIDSRQIVVDAFDPPEHIKCLDALQHLRQTQPKVSIQKSAVAIGVTRMTCKRAVAYLRKMASRDAIDPFVELKTPPEKASRWRKDSLASSRPMSESAETKEQPNDAEGPIDLPEVS